MTCEDIHRYTDVYLDGEFTPADQADFDAHVERCTDCQAFLAEQRAFRTSMRAVLTTQTAPAHLRRRIEEALVEEQRTATMVHIRRWAPALAVAAALAFVLIQPSSSTQEPSVEGVSVATSAAGNDSNCGTQTVITLKTPLAAPYGPDIAEMRPPSVSMSANELCGTTTAPTN